MIPETSDLRQLTLPVGLADCSDFANFHLPAPAAAGDRGRQGAALALQLLQSLPMAPGPRQVHLYGPSGCGRSHLLQAACRAAGAGARYLPLGEIAALDPQVLQGMAGAPLLAVDDVQAIAGRADWEQALFALFNQQRATGAHWLAASRDAPAKLPLGLADLRSRLQWGTVIGLQPLTDADLWAAFRERAERRGLAVSARALQHLQLHAPRDPTRLFALLERLDSASLAARRPVDWPMVRELLASPSAATVAAPPAHTGRRR